MDLNRLGYGPGINAKGNGGTRIEIFMLLKLNIQNYVRHISLHYVTDYIYYNNVGPF